MYPNAPNRRNKLIEPELSFKVVGLLYQVHNKLGHYSRERQYGDLLEILLRENGLLYEREKPIIVAERKSNFVDFCIDNRILVDLKVKPFTTKEDYRQMQRYLTTEEKELGLIVNFRQKTLRPKRILNYKLRK